MCLGCTLIDTSKEGQCFRSGIWGPNSITRGFGSRSNKRIGRSGPAARCLGNTGSPHEISLDLAQHNKALSHAYCYDMAAGRHSIPLSGSRRESRSRENRRHLSGSWHSRHALLCPWHTCVFLLSFFAARLGEKNALNAAGVMKLVPPWTL